MRSFIAVVGMASAVAAQTTGFHAINLPGMYEDVPACSTYTVKWTPSTDAAYAGEVTFGLIGGATQQTLVPIGSNFGSVLGSTGEYAWDVPCDAGADAIYGLKIYLASDLSIFQYSMPFHIVANGGSTTSASASASASASTSESSSMSEMATSTTEAPAETETCTSESTGYGGYNSTMTTVTPPVATSSTNGTIITHKPTGAATIVTSFTTEAGSTGTAAATTTLATAGASRAISGSFAIIAIAAAFFSL